MGSDYSRFIEAQFRERLERARNAYSKSQYDAALRILDELDRNVPHRPEVLELRKACQRGRGVDTFSQDEEKPASSVSFKDVWEPDDARSTPVAPRQVTGKSMAGSLSAWMPGQALQPIPQNPAFEYAPEQSDLAYRIVVCAILATFTLVAAVIFGPPREGATRTFYGMKFVWVPLPEADGTESDRGRGIWMGKYEVSRSEWAAIMDEEGPRLSRDEMDMPVSNTSKEMCLEFVDKLERKGEGHFRIPTSLEWLRACRADTSTSYSFGSDKADLDRYGWYAGNSDSQIHERGRKRSNPWGIYDMHGNVTEWCVDRLEAGAAENAPESDIADDESTPWIWRGGSANLDAGLCTSESGEYPEGDAGNRFAGLRICRDPGPSTKEALRPLDFPKNRSLGIVHISRWEKRPATGRIWVLAQDWVKLVVDQNGLGDLPALADLEANSIQEIDAARLNLEDTDLENIALLEGLEVLDFSNTGMTDRGLAILENSASFRILNVSDTHITGGGLDPISTMTGLHKLDLSGLPGVDDQNLARLSNLSNLEYLDLRKTSVTSESLTELQVLLPRCEIQPRPDSPTPEQRLRRAKVGTKYSMLLQQFRADSASTQYGFFHDEGYSDRTEWGREKDLPAGFWVYVHPFWYIWQDRNRVQRAGMRPWAPENLIGRPNRDPEEPSLATWAPRVNREDEDWLMIEFESPMKPNNLILFGLGEEIGVAEVVFFGLDGKQYPSVSTKLRSSPLEDSWERQFRIDRKAVPVTNRVFLRIESAGTADADRRNEGSPVGAIESVGLREGAIVRWATAAASSSYEGDTAGEMEPAEDAAEETPEQAGASDIEFRGFPGLLHSLNKRL